MNEADRSSSSPSEPAADLSRRSFLGGVGGVTAAWTAGAFALAATSEGATAAAAPGGGSSSGNVRKEQAYRMRLEAARYHRQQPTATHLSNGDEQLYAQRLGSFSKGLPHNAYGEVDVVAYQKLKEAVIAEDAALIEAVPSGAPAAQRMRFVNPLSGAAYDLEGADSHDFVVPPAPAFASAERAGEIVENYWMALLRDVPFTAYATNPLAQQATAELDSLSDFRGPKLAGHVTAQTLFRDAVPGGTAGPYVSQFFLRSQPFGAQYIEPRVRVPLAGGANDFLTTASDWLSVQNGVRPTTGIAFDSTLRYLRNGRDLGQWVHIDVLYQAYFQAALCLMTPPDPSNPFTGGGLGCPINPGNPYLPMQMQEGFGTFGGPYFMTILTEVATRALKAIWFQKWYVHRTLRPEAFAGSVHHALVNGRPYPIHTDALGSQAAAQVHAQNGTYFLPMGFPEGSPLHPSYGSGHATVAGACVTMLKALFDGNHPIANPVVAAGDGVSVVPYTGADAGQLTVAGELNKLASNVAQGRNIAGVHWRSDARASLRLGEEVAIEVLRDQRGSYVEDFGGFTFTRFDGTTITI
jgi:hypothetical protein